MSAIAAVEIAELSKAKAVIEEYCQEYETTMLSSFEKAYEEHNEQGMWACAKILREFNGGASVIKSYVNRHEFFQTPLNLEIDLDLQSSATSKIDLDAPMHAHPFLFQLYQRIIDCCEDEWKALFLIFDESSVVMDSFLQRIFAEYV